MSFRFASLVAVLNLSAAVLVGTAPSIAAEWTIDHETSRIALDGTINGKPRTATLPGFSSEINFDRDELSASNVAIDIRIDEISDKLAEAVTTLKDTDWFAVGQYPLASFTATEFEQVDENTYLARGTVTIKGVEQNVPFQFEFVEYGPDPDHAGRLKAVITGTAPLNRLDFGIGAGWNEKFPTYRIGEDVTVRVDLVASAPAP